jgi:hypothetical protein
MISDAMDKVNDADTHNPISQSKLSGKLTKLIFKTIEIFYMDV